MLWAAGARALGGHARLQRHAHVRVALHVRRTRAAPDSPFVYDDAGARVEELGLARGEWAERPAVHATRSGAIAHDIDVGRRAVHQHAIRTLNDRVASVVHRHQDNSTSLNLVN